MKFDIFNLTIGNYILIMSGSPGTQKILDKIKKEEEFQPSSNSELRGTFYFYFILILFVCHFAQNLSYFSIFIQSRLL